MIRKLSPVLLFLFVGCAALQATVPPTPQSPSEAYIVIADEVTALERTVTAATNEDRITMKQAEAARDRLKEARVALKEARRALDLPTPDLSTAEEQLKATKGLLRIVEGLLGQGGTK